MSLRRFFISNNYATMIGCYVLLLQLIYYMIFIMIIESVSQGYCLSRLWHGYRVCPSGASGALRGFQCSLVFL